MGTAGQAPMVGVQAGHVSRSIAARGGALALFLLAPRRICEHGAARTLAQPHEDASTAILFEPNQETHLPAQDQPRPMEQLKPLTQTIM